MKALWWTAGLALIVVGANVNDPYLVPVQGWSSPVVAAMGLAGLAALLRARLRQPLLLLVLWAAVPVSVLAAEGMFLARKARVLSAEPAVAAELGRHFMVGYTRFAEVEALAARGLIGGIYVTRRNLVGRSAEELRRDIARLQEVRSRSGLPPLLVAADQEGGSVSHLSPWLPARPGLASVAGLPPDRRGVAARALGREHGRDLAGLGVTVNFAPVVDRRTERGWNPLDFRSLIAKRAISDDPGVIGEVAAAYAEGLGEEGVRATIKHFPGMGRISADTHHFRAELDAAPEELEGTDWRPFRHVLAGTPGAMMMVGHVTMTAIDPDRPASHSRRVIHDLIRGKWGFQGVVVTDDLTMSPIYQHGLCTAVIEALDAGIDLLLVAFDGKQFYRAMDCAMTAWKKGDLNRPTRASSLRRLDGLYGPISAPAT